MTNNWSIDVDAKQIEEGAQCRCPFLHLHIFINGMQAHLQVHPTTGEVTGKFKKQSKNNLLAEINPMGMDFDSKKKVKTELIYHKGHPPGVEFAPMPPLTDACNMPASMEVHDEKPGVKPEVIMGIDFGKPLEKANITVIESPTFDNPFYKLWNAPMFDEDLYKVLAEAAQAHREQLRDDGVPYITHPVGVALILATHGLRSYNHIAGALLHDIIEDTTWVYDDVLQCAGVEVADIVQLLTKDGGTSHAVYYKNLKQNSIARQIKIADRIYNLNTMKYAWDSDKAERYIGYTENDYEGWGFDDPYLGKELRRAVDAAIDWFVVSLTCPNCGSPTRKPAKGNHFCDNCKTNYHEEM